MHLLKVRVTIVVHLLCHEVDGVDGLHEVIGGGELGHQFIFHEVILDHGLLVLSIGLLKLHRLLFFDLLTCDSEESFLAFLAFLSCQPIVVGVNWTEATRSLLQLLEPIEDLLLLSL